MVDNNNILVNTGFLVGSESPIDGKAKVQTLADRDQLVTDGLAYESLRTYVVDEKKWYEFDGTDWKEVSEGSGSNNIDDDDVSSTTVYSSEKIDTDFQKITDDNLTTTDKTTTGAINELVTRLDNKANLTDLDKYIPLPTTQTLILYVDNVNGSDDNDGLTEDKPVKTISRNMMPQITPVANYMYFYMLSDYTGTISVPQCKSVSMVSKNVNNPITINGHIFANSIHNFSMQYINVKATTDDTNYGVWLDVTNGSIYKCKSEGFDVGVYCNNGFISFKEFTTTNCTTSIEGMGFCLADVTKSTFNSGDIGIKLTDGSYFTVDAITRDNNKATVFTQNDNGVLFIDKILQNDVLNGEGGASTADAVEYVNDAVGSTNVEEALNKLISDYYYVAPSVTAFTASPSGGTFEVGTTITAPITFNWNYNKDITTQTLTDCTLADETVRTATYNTDITSNKTFTLTANDGKNNVSKNISYSFTNKVWYGSSAIGTYDDSFILGLTTGKLQTNKNGTYTVNVGNDEYFFIAMPTSYNNSGELVGKIGGFETSFNKVATINHTNANGYATNYNIYKSGNHSLGSVSFII